MNLNDPIFSDETKARAYFEGLRWPNGPVCPHCGETEKVYRLEGKSTRPGLIHCNACDGSFTVTTGGVMESSHIPLSKWALAFRLYAASKKGFSAHQLHRQLGISYKSAWFMAHRIREAMTPADAEPMGSGGQTVEVDETFVGGKPRKRNRGARPMSKDKKKWSGAGRTTKVPVMALVERKGRVRSRVVSDVTRQTITEILDKNLDKSAHLVTDDWRGYVIPGREFASHETVNHSEGEYVRGAVTTNTVEGVFSVFKRGMIGTYQHCGEQHLQRYLNEFDFRQSNRAALGVNDDLRTERAIKGAEGKRLTYHQVGGPEEQTAA